MANTYKNSDQKPVTGDIIMEDGMDSPCLVTRSLGWKFERVKIGPKAKKFKPVMSSWSKPASNYTFIEHQNDIEWPMKYVQISPSIAMLGDLFVDNNDHSIYYIVVELGPIDGEVTLADIGDTNHVFSSGLTTVKFMGNQNSIVIPEYTTDALKFLFKKNGKHHPEVGDIYSDKYNSCYQVVELPALTNQAIVLAAMQPKLYASKDHEWPMFLYSDVAAYDFFDGAKFLGTPDETLHAPNIGDIYVWGKNNTDVDDTAQYMIVTDIDDKYIAPTLLYIDNNYDDMGSFGNDYVGATWDSLEQFLGHELSGKSWQFLENQEDIHGGLTFPSHPNKKKEYSLDPVTQEQIKLGTLLAYVPNAVTYHDCLVVTTGNQGFSVWWLAFKGGDDKLEEGFKQTFKFDKHLPLFLYNGHQDDFLEQGQPILTVDNLEKEQSPTSIQDALDKVKEDETKEQSPKHPSGKPPVQVGQIIDYTTPGTKFVTTCLVIELSDNHMRLALIDTEWSGGKIEYSFSDYFEQKEWTFVQHMNDDDALTFMTPIDEVKLTSGKVGGIIKHSMVEPTPLHGIMEGTILNYYPYKDMQLPKKQAQSFWTLLVTEIGTENHLSQFKVIILDKDNKAPNSPNTSDHYWFTLDTYLKGDQGTLKYVMHMNDTAILSDADDAAYYDVLQEVKESGVDVTYPTG